MSKVDYLKIAKKASSIQISELRKVNKIFNKSFFDSFMPIFAGEKKLFSFIAFL